uniref:Uncharacterized protein n=1 Tax=Cacopsylla melanoneura TaxID=428564 RepID=A0A8D8WWB7_9HEMI
MRNCTALFSTQNIACRFRINVLMPPFWREISAKYVGFWARISRTISANGIATMTFLFVLFELECKLLLSFFSILSSEMSLLFLCILSAVDGTFPCSLLVTLPE